MLDQFIIDNNLLSKDNVGLLFGFLSEEKKDLKEFLLEYKIIDNKSLLKLKMIENKIIDISPEIAKSLFNKENLISCVKKIEDDKKLAELKKIEDDKKLAELKKIEDDKNKIIDYPHINEIVGKCELTSVLGHGATAQVYLAFHKFLRKNVAMKILSPKLIKSSNDPEIEEKFLYEGVSAAKLNHSNILRVFDAGQDRYTYIISEYVDGYNLMELLEQSGAIKPSLALKIMIDVCKALNYALEFNLIHRDIKPGNIMLTKKSEVKVADFGLAKILHSKDFFKSERGVIYGTPYYMPPEQILSEKEDHRYDMYSLGATFYHLLTGKLPFDEKSIEKLIFMHLKEIPVAPKNIVPQIGLAFSNVILKLMEKNPNDRYQDYTSLIKDLESIQSESANLKSGSGKLIESVSKNTSVLDSVKSEDNNSKFGTAKFIESVSKNKADPDQNKESLRGFFMKKIFGKK
ncbi:MAG: serine/threonine-protein kinase [Cyanobacteriota bacterium]